MKRALKTLLCGLMASLLLAGCTQTGGSSGSNSSSTESAPESTVSQTSEAAEGETTYDENGVSPEGTFPIVEEPITLTVMEICVPTLVYTEEQSATLANTESVVISYVEEMAAAFITGTSDPEADWDAYLNELSVKGVDQLLEIYQAAYDARS